MYELNSLLQSIFCIRKVQFNLFIQKIQEVQHADSAAADYYYYYSSNKDASDSRLDIYSTKSEFN